MKFISKFILFLYTLFGVAIYASAQEYFIHLDNNPVLREQVKYKTKKSLKDVMVELPIIDDFSSNSPYPSMDFWTDDFAFINNSYAVSPPSIGVATLDALDRDGSIYTKATISPQTFDADFLSSHPIKLNYPASDSIYLSFFYQPMGKGAEPESFDSLCLDFYKPLAGVWKNVWRIPGDTIHDFKQVLIQVNDTSYLKEGFRFRFRNKASLIENSHYPDKRGNDDHWNIDYVKLDRNRSWTDTIVRDVAFISPPSSMLKKYESLPWEHFKAAYTTIYLPYISLHYFNNDSIDRNVTRSMEIKDEVWGETYDPRNFSTQDIFPGTSSRYDITSIYPFQFTRGDTASYSIKTWLRTDDFDNKANDTVYRKQIFRDYFAYDDGSAEFAYGLRGDGTANGLIAVRFNSFIEDQLGGVDVYFTHLYDSLNLNYYYKFMVWDDKDGMPGNVIYEGETDYTAVYSEELNKYVRFKFDKDVNVSGKFYVGIFQYKELLLNIGADASKPNTGDVLYNEGKGWKQSEVPGSLMFRPFVKRSYSSNTEKNITAASLIKIWPNPADEYFRLESQDILMEGTIKTDIFDIRGKLVRSSNQFQHEIYIEDLPEGFYIVSFSSNNRHITTEKLLIQR
ncbi:T9SS type A sorting domain-containing protein [Bacteroidota bacterium]